MYIALMSAGHVRSLMQKEGALGLDFCFRQFTVCVKDF
jgi:hypothetical protein